MTATVLRLVRILLLVLSAAGLAVALLPLATTDAWWVRYLDYPRIQFTVGMLAILAGLLLVSRKTATTAFAAAFIVGGLGWNAVLLAPYVLPLVIAWPKPTVAQADRCPSERRLRVLTVNVQMGNQHDHRLLELVRRVDPDVAWFQETDDWWERELASLSETMPHGIADTQSNYYGVHLFSRLPLEGREIRHLTRSRNPSAFATVVLASGDRIKVYAVHPRPPQVGQGTAERDAQMMATALEAHGDRVPHVVMGDMNTVPWENIADRMRRVGGFFDPRVGRGLFVTWNANDALLKWPLDHVMPGPGWTLLKLEVLPEFGSDHRPLLADLCLGSTAIAPSSVDPADLRQAKHTVDRGQGKAVGRDASGPPGAVVRNGY